MTEILTFRCPLERDAGLLARTLNAPRIVERNSADPKLNDTHRTEGWDFALRRPANRKYSTQWNDAGPREDDVHAFEQAVKAGGKPIDVKIYDGAGHAFENPNNQGGYRPEAAADAWKRTVAFLGRTLK